MTALTLIDLHPGIATLDDASPDAFMTSWRRYMNDEGLARHLIRDASIYDFDRDCFPVIQKALSREDLIDEAHDNFLFSLRELEESFTALFDSPEIRVVFYLGLCNGAGWMTKVRGINHVLIGVEKIIELGWWKKSRMLPLLAHELAHAAHEALRARWLDEYAGRRYSVMRLYIEGFAEFAAQRMTSRNMRGTEWLFWCEAHQEEIAAVFRERIAKEKRTDDFYGDWHSLLGQSDLGYYLGLTFIEDWAKETSLKTIGEAINDDIEKRFLRFLDAAVENSAFRNE